MTNSELQGEKIRSGKVILSIIVGLAGAVFTIALLNLSLKWSIVLIAGLIGGFFILTKRPNVEQWLFLFFLTFSIQLNFFPIHFPYLYSNHPVRGIPINIFDIPLLFLSLSVFYRSILGEISLRRSWVYVLPFFCAIILVVVKSFKVGESAIMLIAMFWAILKCLLLFLVLSLTINSRQRLIIAVTALCSALMLHSSLAFVEIIHGKPLGLSILGETRVATAHTDAGMVKRVGGLIGNENLFSKYIGLHLPLLLSLLFSPLRFRVRLFFIMPLFILACAADIATYCRFGWISASIVLAVTLSLVLYKKTGRKILLLAGPLITGISALLILTTMPSVKARMSKIEVGSGVTRLEQYSIALNMIRENPLDGIGFGRFVPIAGSFDQTRSNVSLHFTHPVHNEYLLMGAELGLIVLSLYLFMLIYTIFNCFKSSWKSNDITGWIALGMAGGLCTYALQDLTEWSWAFQLVPLWSFIACSRAAGLLADKSGGEK